MPISQGQPISRLKNENFKLGFIEPVYEKKVQHL